MRKTSGSRSVAAFAQSSHFLCSSYMRPGDDDNDACNPNTQRVVSIESQADNDGKVYVSGYNTCSLGVEQKKANFYDTFPLFHHQLR